MKKTFALSCLNNNLLWKTLKIIFGDVKTVTIFAPALQMSKAVLWDFEKQVRRAETIKIKKHWKMFGDVKNLTTFAPAFQMRKESKFFEKQAKSSE